MDFRFFDLYPKMPGFCRICRTFVVMPRKRLWLNQLQGQAMKQAIQARATLQATTPSENVSLTPHPLRIFEFGRLEKNHFQETNPPTMVLILVGWNSNALSGASPGSWCKNWKKSRRFAPPKKPEEIGVFIFSQVISGYQDTSDAFTKGCR